MKTGNLLLWGLGAFAVYEFVIKPKQTPVISPVSITPAPTNPIASILSLLTGKPVSNSSTSPYNQIIQAATGASGGGGNSAGGSGADATGAAASAGWGPVYSSNAPAGATYEDMYGNFYDANGRVLAYASSTGGSYVPVTPSGGSDGSGGGYTPPDGNYDAIDPSTGESYLSEQYNGD